MSAFKSPQELRVPGHGHFQALQHRVRRRVAQQAAGLADVGLRVAHVARAEVGVYGLFAVGHVLVAQGLDQETEQVVQRAAAADGHVVDLVAAFCRRHRGQQVGLPRGFHKAEVAAGLAVAIDDGVVALDHRGGPLRDHGGVGAVRILALAEHVEVAQAHRFEPVRACEHVRIQFVHELGHGAGWSPYVELDAA
ncbi:hypothetical protein G6F40_014749 [Rhizopus arrhizus]|nr:hypothetical protein G6F40_014749 [Rhizopus arrhizus]